MADRYTVDGPVERPEEKLSFKMKRPARNKSWGLVVGSTESGRNIVASVDAGGIAEKAGLRVG